MDDIAEGVQADEPIGDILQNNPVVPPNQINEQEQPVGEFPGAMFLMSLPALTGQNTKDFFDSLANISNLLPWTAAQKKAIVLLKLEGEAKRFYKNSLEVQHPNFNQLKQELIRHFAEESLFENSFEKLTSCMMGNFESTKAFASRLTGLVNKCTTMDGAVQPVTQEFKQKLLLTHFVKGLLPEIKKQVIMFNPQNFVDATAIAERVQKSLLIDQPQTVNVATPSSEGVIQNLAEAVTKLQQQVSNLQLKLETNTKSQNFQSDPNRLSANNKKSNLVCYYCNKMGHTSRECRLKQSHQRQNFQIRPSGQNFNSRWQAPQGQINFRPQGNQRSNPPIMYPPFNAQTPPFYPQNNFGHPN